MRNVTTLPDGLFVEFGIPELLDDDDDDVEVLEMNSLPPLKLLLLELEGDDEGDVAGEVGAVEGELPPLKRTTREARKVPCVSEHTEILVHLRLLFMISLSLEMWFSLLLLEG